MNRFFMYVDPTEYEMTQEGLMKACLAEVIAEAKDTGDYPMYRDEDLLICKMEDGRYLKRHIPISGSTFVNKCFGSRIFTPNAWIILYNNSITNPQSL